MLSRMPPKNTLESSRASSSLLWKCLRTFVYAFEPSPRKCEGEGSNEGFSAQYARSNLQSIYQVIRDHSKMGACYAVFMHVCIIFMLVYLSSPMLFPLVSWCYGVSQWYQL